MRDAKRGLTYLAEEEAFKGTLLAERPGFLSLEHETREVLASEYWKALIGAARARRSVTIEQIRSNSIDGDATFQHVRYTPHADRGTVCHELAHVAAHNTVERDHQSHGPEWRGLYVELVDVTYGSQYAALLRTSFQDHRLAIDTTHCVGRTTRPIVDIDNIVGITQGGWRRKRPS